MGWLGRNPALPVPHAHRPGASHSLSSLVCAVAVSFGMLMGCGGDLATETPDTLCRKECPSSGICSSGSACRVGMDGTPYCI